MRPKANHHHVHVSQPNSGRIRKVRLVVDDSSQVLLRGFGFVEDKDVPGVFLLPEGWTTDGTWYTYKNEKMFRVVSKDSNERTIIEA